MGFKNITYPPLVVTSGNEIPLVIAETDAFITKGAEVKGRITLIGFHLVNDSITLAWNNRTITYTCVSNYYGQAGAYPVRVTGTIQEWGLLVYNILASNYYLANDFIISYRSLATAFIIYFEPIIKQAYNNLTITVNTASQYSKVNSSFSPDALYQNYKCKVQLLQEKITGDTVARVKYRSAVYPQFTYTGINAALQYDIKSLTYDETDGHFSFPETSIVRNWSIVKKYFIQLSFLAENISQITLPATQFFYVLPGKISVTKEKALNTAISNIYKELLAKKQFLSFAPLRKTTDIYAPEKLYFLFLSSSNANLFVEEKYTDNTSEKRFIGQVAAYEYSCHEFSIGFQNIKKEDYNGLIPSEYSVWLEDGSGNLISEKRTFVLDYKYQRSARYFAFKNSFGVYEIFRTTGNAKKSIKTEKEFYSRNVFQHKNADQLRKPLEINQQFSIEINSGILPKQWSTYYMSEFLSSPDAYWLKNRKKYAVQIEEGSEPVSDNDKINLHDFNFKITIDDIDDSFYSDFEIDGLGGDFSNDFSEDFNI